MSAFYAGTRARRSHREQRLRPEVDLGAAMRRLLERMKASPPAPELEPAAAGVWRRRFA